MTHPRTFRPMGPTAALVECRPGDAGPVVVAAERAGVSVGVAGVLDIVPAAATILVECVDTESLDRALRVVCTVQVGEDGPVTAEEFEVPVCFDGADLDEVADRCGRSVDAVVGAIVSAQLRVAFCGFAPGFAYLDGLQPWLHLPRRDAPRSRVPDGSFAIAAGYAAVYPTASPGGWHLLGHTDVEVWSTDRDPPALLTPGTAVRIVATGAPTSGPVGES